MAATPAYSGPEPAAPVSPIFGVSVPEGYRDWILVGVAQETGDLDELRAALANPAALKSHRAGTLPFPDGSALVKLAWRRQQSPEFTPAFVPGGPTTIQVMVKDQARFSATGGWGFGRFIGSEPADEAQHRTCFACHSAAVRDHDFVFTRLAP
jgi:hypothetical protein